jgi:pimeloyl-ACP methyl ester carboxylesterase
MAVLYAATYPERTRALALFHPRVRPGTGDRANQQTVSEFRERWGTQEFSDELLRDGLPSLYDSEEERRSWANWLRVGASPAVAGALSRAFYETDLSDVLPAVRVPTLILYRSINEDAALDVAARIPSARTLRLSGTTSLGSSSRSTSLSGSWRERKRHSFPTVS